MTYADGAESGGSVAGQRNGRATGVELADLSHREAREQFTDLLDGALDEAAQGRLARHLKGCASCTAYFRTFRSTVDLLGSLPARRVPDRLADRLRAVVSQEPVA